MVMPISARDQELDLLRPNLAVLQQQVQDIMVPLHRLWVISEPAEDSVSPSLLFCLQLGLCVSSC